MGLRASKEEGGAPGWLNELRGDYEREMDRANAANAELTRERDELRVLLRNNQERREEVEARHGDLLRENARLRAYVNSPHAERARLIAAAPDVERERDELRAEAERLKEQHEIDNGVQEKLYEERDDALHQAERLAHEVERLKETIAEWQITQERDELRAEVERTSESAAAMLKVITEDLPRIQAQRDDARAEVERLTLADRQWADHVKRLSEENERLRAALKDALELADEGWSYDCVEYFRGKWDVDERLRVLRQI